MCKLVELDTSGAVQKNGKTRRELSILWSSNYWFICGAVSHGFDVDLLIVVALEGHLGMNCLLVVADPSLWVTQIAFQQDVGHPQVELIRGVVPAQKIYISEWTSNKALHPFKNDFSTYHIFWKHIPCLLVDILPLLMFDQNSLENWGLCSVVVLDLEVCKEDDGGVGGEEDEDVPGPVEVGETHACPPVTKSVLNFSKIKSI